MVAARDEVATEMEEVGKLRGEIVKLKTSLAVSFPAPATPTHLNKKLEDCENSVKEARNEMKTEEDFLRQVNDLYDDECKVAEWYQEEWHNAESRTEKEEAKANQDPPGPGAPERIPEFDLFGGIPRSQERGRSTEPRSPKYDPPASTQEYRNSY